MSKPQLILVAGPSGSGKSTFAKGLAQQLKASKKSSCVIALDNYYRDLRQMTKKERSGVNFDEPGAWEHARILRDAVQLKKGEPVNIPVYDFSTHLRMDQTICIEPTDTIIMEGLFALCYAELNELADLKIYVALDDATALERRILRDTKQRGRSRESVIRQYEETVRPANTLYIQPSAQEANIQVSGTDSLKEQIKAIFLSHAH
jgi:uridine kinase